MEVIIVGGGIARFATALSLHAVGIACRVYEALPEVRPLGVGINVLPHSIKELDDLGLLDRLEATGVTTQELVYATKRGEIVWREPRGRFAGYKWPQISIHRGHLHMLLYRAAREHIGDDRIHLNHSVVDADLEAERRWLRFRATDGGQSLPSATADLVVAADGIHSPIRASSIRTKARPHGAA
jgi:2-polyprenyl-6-methoxyphenol hydroxylase-like FAD-dependent oxidoreductase